MDTSSASAVNRPRWPGGPDDTAVRHRPVWAPAATHPLAPPLFPAERLLLVVDGRDNARAWVPGSVRTVRAGRDVTGSAMSWSTYLDEVRPAGIVVDLPAGTTGVERAMDLVLPILRAACGSTGCGPLHVAFLATGHARPELAAALGALAQIAAVEDGRLRAVSVRVTAPPAWAQDPFQVARAELALPRPGLAEVRYTPAGREVRVLRADHRPGDARTLLRRGGRYLVTTDADGPGEQLAQRLVRELGARVTLLKAGEGETRGVLRVSGRPSRYDDVRTAVQAALRAHGGLDGVLHWASGGEVRPLARLSAAVAREAVADAVGGAVHLDRATAGLPLDFFALATAADPYRAVVGAAVPAAIARALTSLTATRTRLAAAGARAGVSLSVCRPDLHACLDTLGGGHGPAGHSGASRAA
ncbi:KR domain-containing protein [Streptomyces sp. NPDC002817]|uniref:KR domain-containing protein n=1 Tax=Streptomyces sp. NPDC088357 TaxID=3154655 RepID=UPI0034169707